MSIVFLAAGLGCGILALAGSPGAAVLLVSALVARLVRDRPAGQAMSGRHESVAAVWQGLLGIFGKRVPWPILPMCFTGYAVLITVRGLWAGPYLATLLGMMPIQRGNVLLVMSLAMIAGNLIYGQIERRFDRRRRPALLGSALGWRFWPSWRCGRPLRWWR